MNVTPASRWLHRFAWLTATLTLLLPVATGALVTTLDAGMIFSDWPSSDGYNMLAYPWLSSNRDQFAEHGHRLSGMVIGLLSIALSLATWFVERRPLARWLGLAVFVAVCVQGGLGGARVLLDRQTMALIHGDFGAAVFCLMCVFVLVTRPNWESRLRIQDAAISRLAMVLSIALMASLVIQYFLGGVLRHLIPYGMAGSLDWAGLLHPWFAIVPALLSPLFVVVARRSGSHLVRRGAQTLLALVVGQVLLGLASWCLRHGFPQLSIVAQPGAPWQVAVCSLHKVVGMLTLMTSVLNVVSVSSVRTLAESRVGERKFEGSMMGVAT